MAYFANSSEGEYFDNQCDECLHSDIDIACPVSMVQLMFNYDQCCNKKLEEAMTCLVNKTGDCQMKPFIDVLRNKEADRKNEVKLFKEKN